MTSERCTSKLMDSILDAAFKGSASAFPYGVTSGAVYHRLKDDTDLDQTFTGQVLATRCGVRATFHFGNPPHTAPCARCWRP